MGSEYVIAIIGFVIGILQGVLILMIKQLIYQFKKVCEDNEKEHNELWRRVNYHSHTEHGKVVVEEAS